MTQGRGPRDENSDPSALKINLWQEFGKRTGKVGFLQVEEWGKWDQIVHGFGRKGGPGDRVSKADWRGQDLKAGDELVPLVALRQVHGDRIIVFPGGSQQAEDLWQQEGDALISCVPGYALSVFTADCLPILLFDPVGQAVGIIHAGWRGTAKAISRKAVGKMKEVFGSRSENIEVAMGPCIGGCCLEVDNPVREAFSGTGLSWERITSPRGKDKWVLDLRRANARLLEEAGIEEEKIRRVDYCTSCHPNMFFSYRAGGKGQGRQMNFIALRPKTPGTK
jgi:YfiH family protein